MLDLKKLSNINGYLRDDEARLLYSLAKKVLEKNFIVEIRSWELKSTVCLGLGSLYNSKNIIYAIDPHTGSTEHQKKFGKIDTLKNFKKNILNAGVSKIIKPLVMKSHKAIKFVKTPVGFLFIDGAHDYKSVNEDFLDWSPKVVDGGIIAFHDTIDWPGPKKVVEKYLFKSKNFKNIRVVGSITYGEKTDSFSTFDYLKNHYVYFTKILRSLIASLKLPQPLHSLAKSLYYKIQ